MTFQLANPITAHELTFMPGTPNSPEEFGWIRLINRNQDAGYVYLSAQRMQPHLNSNKTYIVTSIPMSQLSTMLNILQNERHLQIRFFDAESPGVEPSVFIESVGQSEGDSAAILAEAKALQKKLV